MVADAGDYPFKVSVKVSLRIQHLKTQLFLHVSSRRLGGHGGSWQTLRWCHMTCINPLKLFRKFHPNPTLRSLLILYLSFKSLPWVMEDIEVPEEPGNSVIWHVSTLWSCCENFIKIQHQEPYQDSTCPPSPFQESWRKWRSLTNLEMVFYDMYQLPTLWSGCKVPFGSWNGSR